MTNLTIAEVNTAIITGNFTNEQLNSIGDAIKFARAQIATKNKFTLVKGTNVKFTNSRSGQTVIGTVEKVNRKFIIVQEKGKAFGGSWRVPANMLSAA
jgi:UTP-glucose-1-phosphate uridylyltransferase